MPHGFRDMPGFLPIKLPRRAFANRAKAAVPRADVAA